MVDERRPVLVQRYFHSRWRTGFCPRTVSIELNSACGVKDGTYKWFLLAATFDSEQQVIFFASEIALQDVSNKVELTESS